MRYLSTNGKSPSTSFRDALFRGLAPDGGLYIPEDIPLLPKDYFENLKDRSFCSIGSDVASSFIGEIPADQIQSIVSNAWDFDVPLVKLDSNIFLLELFHGPTLAFKDIGARFMAQTMSYFLKKEQRRVSILVATSGDTGSAVAQGFLNSPNITVYILYPSGKISPLQEQQMATLGGNIRALEVRGTFDDCQRIVKQALGDGDIRKKQMLTTANSINLGRLVPQIAYYLWTVARLKTTLNRDAMPTIVVPSGNFGNLTAGVYARWMGASIQHFVAATNANDVVPQYFASGTFTPRTSVQTCSNAMDVGNPSNLARLQALYNGDLNRMRKDISTASITDDETLQEIRRTYKSTGYILDPHTAVGVAACRSLRSHSPIIVTATAHPAKFQDVIRQAIGVDIPLPPSLRDALQRPKLSTAITADYNAVKDYLLGDV